MNSFMAGEKNLYWISDRYVDTITLNAATQYFEDAIWNVFQQIEKAEIPYDALDSNSNFAADIAIFHVTGRFPTSDDFFDFYAPGSIERGQLFDRLRNLPEGDLKQGIISSVQRLLFEERIEADPREFLDGNIFNFARCFSAGTPVSMWPVDAGLVPGADGIYDQQEVLRHIWHKPIEQVSKTDIVVAHDAAGNLVPGTVTRTFVNEVDHVLDVFGLKVTPGHVTLCGDGPLKGRYVPMLDIIRSDGAFVREDGTLVRAATNCPVGSPGDRKVQMIGGVRAPNGDVTVHETGWVRLGMRGVLADGRDVSMLDLLEQNGSIVTDDGLVATAPGEKGAKLLWPFAPHLPKPEDYILARSGVTLEEIEAAEAEENALWKARATGQIPASLAGTPAGNDAPTHGFVMAPVGASSGPETAAATSPSPVPETEPALPDLSHWGELSTPDYSALNERQAQQTPLNRQQRRNQVRQQAKMATKQATPAQQHSSTIH